jgi:DNA (cytosine-5)-methyltransferase 1
MNKRTGSTDVFGRMVWDKPAPTIRTEFFKPEKGRYLHPEAHRPITIREAARLQTFPDEFSFIGSPVQVAKQIGNAVPVLLAERIAEHVRDVVLGGFGGESPSIVHHQEQLLSYA